MTSNRLKCISLERNMAGTLIILIVTGGVVGAFRDVEINTLWGNSVPYVCWHQELVCCDHKSAPTVILILKCPRFIPCPPLLSCMFMGLLLTVIRSPWKSSCGLFSDLCRSFRFSVKWSHWVYSCCALIPLDPSYVKRFSLPGRTCCWATRADASLDK